MLNLGTDEGPQTVDGGEGDPLERTMSLCTWARSESPDMFPHGGARSLSMPQHQKQRPQRPRTPQTPRRPRSSIGIRSQPGNQPAGPAELTLRRPSSAIERSRHTLLAEPLATPSRREFADGNGNASPRRSIICPGGGTAASPPRASSQGREALSGIPHVDVPLLGGGVPASGPARASARELSGGSRACGPTLSTQSLGAAAQASAAPRRRERSPQRADMSGTVGATLLPRCPVIDSAVAVALTSPNSNRGAVSPQGRALLHQAPASGAKTEEITGNGDGENEEPEAEGTPGMRGAESGTPTMARWIVHDPQSLKLKPHKPHQEQPVQDGGDIAHAECAAMELDAVLGRGTEAPVVVEMASSDGHGAASPELHAVEACAAEAATPPASEAAITCEPASLVAAIIEAQSRQPPKVGRKAATPLGDNLAPLCTTSDCNDAASSLVTAIVFASAAPPSPPFLGSAVSGTAAHFASCDTSDFNDAASSLVTAFMIGANEPSPLPPSPGRSLAEGRQEATRAKVVRPLSPRAGTAAGDGACDESPLAVAAPEADNDCPFAATPHAESPIANAEPSRVVAVAVASTETSHISPIEFPLVLAAPAAAALDSPPVYGSELAAVAIFQPLPPTARGHGPMPVGVCGATAAFEREEAEAPAKALCKPRRAFRCPSRSLRSPARTVAKADDGQEVPAVGPGATMPSPSEADCSPPASRWPSDPRDSLRRTASFAALPRPSLSPAVYESCMPPSPPQSLPSSSRVVPMVAGATQPVLPWGTCAETDAGPAAAATTAAAGSPDPFLLFVPVDELGAEELPEPPEDWHAFANAAFGEVLEWAYS
eukprot:NODE_611_length_2889_cov_3.965243.p1 GENE.NODE_611_length_2889_cov_3.965243~~NODE_611_length_2889_cov_3.965243.p1  ORF type:complete len:830 (+),score=207.52 NODE_611_length_2889_cov_3.965243:1-2490(+)